MKKERHNKIKEIIRDNDIETQDELVKHLQDAGFNVTQATISRDIRDLQLTKVPNGFFGSKYALLQEESHVLSNKYLRVFKDGFLSIDVAQNMLVVKTVPGMAMAVAAAIDAMKFKEIIGSIAGDDTIMMALSCVEDAIKVSQEIRTIAEE